MKELRNGSFLYKKYHGNITVRNSKDFVYVYYNPILRGELIR